MRKFVISLGVIVLITMVYYGQAGKSNNVQVEIEKSDKFSEEEIKEAAVAVKKKFRGFKGCELTELWYEEKESNEFVDSYLKTGKGSVNGVEAENTIVFLSNFSVDSSGGDGSFEPNSTQSNWMWIVIRDRKSGDWRVDDWGY